MGTREFDNLTDVYIDVYTTDFEKFYTFQSHSEHKLETIVQTYREKYGDLWEEMKTGWDDDKNLFETLAVVQKEQGE